MKTCNNCETKTKEAQTGPDNCYYCDDCFNELFISCYSCDGLIEIDDALTSSAGDCYCQSCYDERYATCDYCNREVEIDSAHSNDDGDYYHDNCYYEVYTSCESCSCEIERDNAYYDDDCCYCESCYQELGGLRSYSYKPEPVFTKTNTKILPS